jgi:hypothetical protein
MGELEQAAAALASAPSVAVISHVNPEGDAIGTILGVAQSLRAAGKRAAAFNADPLPPWLAHLPGAEEIRRTRSAAGRGPRPRGMPATWSWTRATSSGRGGWSRGGRRTLCS